MDSTEKLSLMHSPKSYIYIFNIKGTNTYLASQQYSNPIETSYRVILFRKYVVPLYHNLTIS